MIVFELVKIKILEKHSQAAEEWLEEGKVYTAVKDLTSDSVIPVVQTYFIINPKDVATIPEIKEIINDIKTVGAYVSILKFENAAPDSTWEFDRLITVEEVK